MNEVNPVMGGLMHVACWHRMSASLGECAIMAWNDPHCLCLFRFWGRPCSVVIKTLQVLIASSTAAV